jgi:pyruvate decarboxylase
LASFVLCNDGYTIERYIHGWDAGYNDIQPWKFKDLVPAFGAREGQYSTHQIHNKQELQGLLKDKDFSDAKRLQVSLS